MLGYHHFMNLNELDCTKEPLNLAATLKSGQAFRWRQDDAGTWWGTVRDSVLALSQPSGTPHSPVLWQTYPVLDQVELVTDYFRLNMKLDDLYSEWCEADPRMAAAVEKYRGLRILDQPPDEALFAFLCATAKPIPQIERLVYLLAKEFGEAVTVPGAPNDLHLFPTIDALAQAPESAIRAMGWGFRAPRVPACANILVNDPELLPSLIDMPYAEAVRALQQFPGIGGKVADCKLSFIA